MSFIVKRGDSVQRITAPSSLIGWSLVLLLAVQGGLSLGLSYSTTHILWRLNLTAEAWPDLPGFTETAFAIAVAIHFIAPGVICWPVLAVTSATAPGFVGHLKLLAGSRALWLLIVWWLSGLLILIGSIGSDFHMKAWLLVVGPVASCVTFVPAFRHLLRISSRNASEPFFAGLDESTCQRLQPISSPRPLTGLKAVDAIRESTEARRYARLAKSMSRNRELAERIITLVATAAFGIAFASFLEAFEPEGTGGSVAIRQSLLQLLLSVTLFLFGLSLRLQAAAYSRAADSLLARAEKLDAPSRGTGPLNMLGQWLRRRRDRNDRSNTLNGEPAS